MKLLGSRQEEQVWAAAHALSQGSAHITAGSVVEFLRCAQKLCVERTPCPTDAYRYFMPEALSPTGWTNSMVFASIRGAALHGTLICSNTDIEDALITSIPPEAHGLWSYRTTHAPALPTDADHD